jgi:hypothetical protein
MRYALSYKLVVAAAALLMIGCASGQAGNPADDPTQEPTSEVLPVQTEEVPDSQRPEKDLTLTPSIPFDSTNSPIPADLLGDMIDDLAANQNIDSSQISVVEAREVVWNDGSLGCSQPGQSYTMAEVPGYYVVLQENSRQHKYHSARSGYFLECASSTGAPGAPES